MSKTVNIGGDRLGSGNKMNVTMHGFERSNHNMGYIWKNTQAPGTLVPFMTKVALPGDVFEIKLDAQVRTHPTIGPLFGSFKLQLDVFQCPIRLYNSLLHNNTLNIGNEISKVKFPLMTLYGKILDLNSKVPLEFQHINQSCIHAYLGNRGLPQHNKEEGLGLEVNAIPYLAYWEIFKNYYANKQEEKAYVIHGVAPQVLRTTADDNGALWPPLDNLPHICNTDLFIMGVNITRYNIQVQISGKWYPILEKFNFWYDNTMYPNGEDDYIAFKVITPGETIQAARIDPEMNYSDIKPKLQSFDLRNIDIMRKSILMADESLPFDVTNVDIEPYNLPTTQINDPINGQTFCIMGQEGLAIKTYQSDIFNNWISTETYESITSRTSISTVGNSFTIDQLNMSMKVYELLNRISASGSSYEDWIEAAYDTSSRWRSEIPIYCGGLSKEIVFQEVVSTAATDGDPLGSLAGKGTMSTKHKGGDITIKVDEPSYIIGICSITPRISYSQGNKWDTRLKTLDDLHKPSLDGIGFQDLITDQMAFWDSHINGIVPGIIYKSAGKQPAWLNYMTEYDRNYGNFADERSQQFMVLDRKYSPEEETVLSYKIKDLTTYIDPSKFNYAFAQTDLSAMNFWVQIGIDDESRRKMSAKIIPNL